MGIKFAADNWVTLFAQLTLTVRLMIRSAREMKWFAVEIRWSILIDPIRISTRIGNPKDKINYRMQTFIDGG